MNIKSYIKKLRNAADSLEDLFITNEDNETPKVAKKILKAKKKYLHWTKRSENKQKVMKIIRKMIKAKQAKNNEI